MKPDRWRQVDDLFEAALQYKGADRAAFLDRACTNDPSLRREVEKMLKIDERAGNFIERDVFDVAADLLTTAPAPHGYKPEGIRLVPVVQTSPTGGSIDDARFVPGDVLADRYRIVGLLGRGGMGEVYRADDLKLKEPVALKFLPERLSNDGAALARFYREVSVARQISHRHVCRVYDIGEFQGLHFISMEYVRGEDLGSLIKRIGRLPQDKAIDISRQLAAGLSAIHDNGVLHRDLKPANIMVDDRGDVRVTDFGIAALAEELEGRDAFAGTPAYMAPEQLEGKSVTVRSDIFSLGVVLYEVFTGKRPFEATTLKELLELRRSNTQPSSPSKVIADIDPMVERVICRCLEVDPSNRPGTALKVAAALPGGDPLAAALAAGETPSPEMVAAAPKQGALRPAIALSLFGSLLVLLATMCFLAGKVGLYEQVPLDKSPEVLRNRASELNRELGYVEAPVDVAYGMGVDRRYLRFIEDNDQTSTRWKQLSSGQPAAIYFWYRESPRPLVASDGVHEKVPASEVPGMSTMTLDTVGRLRSFQAVPPSQSLSGSDQTTFDWSVLFTESGLDITKFQQVDPVRTPFTAYTSRSAWEGSYATQPERKVRVEAAAFEGKPVFFELVDEWDQPTDPRASTDTAKDRVLVILLLSLFLTVLLGSAFLAWKNVRMGRGDRQGAWRVAVFITIMFFFQWIFDSHHVASEQEAFGLIVATQKMIFWAIFFWVVYLAFEPFVRRRWPERIISWTRLMSGGWRDPLVGRDILIGSLVGVGVILINFYLTDLVPRWLGYPPRSPWMDHPATQLLGIRSFAFGFTNQFFAGPMQSFILLFLIFGLRLLLRKDWMAFVVAWAIVATALALAHPTLIGVPFALMTAGLIVWCLYRYGLLATTSAIFFLHFVIFYPVTLNFSAWYATDFLLALLIGIALAGYGFYTSLAGQSLFRGDMLEH